MEIGAALRFLGLPFAVAADFNATPQEVTESGLASLLGGTTWQVPGADHTCTAGQGRVLDFWVVNDLARWVTENPRLVLGTPWKPHYAIAFDLVPLATIVVGSILVRDWKILNEAARKADPSKLDTASTGQWYSAGRAWDNGCKTFGKDVRHRGQGNDYTEDEITNGRTLAGWAAQVATCLASSNGLDGDSTAH